MVRRILEQKEPDFSPILETVASKTMIVDIHYDGVEASGARTLEVMITQSNPNGILEPKNNIAMKTLFLDGLDSFTRVPLAFTDVTGPLYVDVVARDSNRNIILQARHPSLVNKPLRSEITLTAISEVLATDQINKEFLASEIIQGHVNLPKGEIIPSEAVLHIQLLEDALAGGRSMSIAGEVTVPLAEEPNPIPFTFKHEIWDLNETSSLVFKSWVTDARGRKIFVMNAPAAYSGPDIEYDIRLDALRQGRDTKKGLTLDPALMAQTLIHGDAIYDPVNGIPGEARLKISLRQDRGLYDQNPVIAEQTLILHNMETHIPFRLTTDSTDFDPYIPAPFISITLTDKFGRVYYDSGAVRARESKNIIRLYPQ